MSGCCSPRITRRRSCARTWHAISPIWSCGASPACETRAASRPSMPARVTVSSPAPAVLLLSGIDRVAVALLLARYGLTLTLVASGEAIPGSYWGDSEAGLQGDTLFARLDTPLHSVLHEAAHYVCMTPERRAGLDRDAGGEDLEESAVCYLQVLFAGEVPHIGRERLFID